MEEGELTLDRRQPCRPEAARAPGGPAAYLLAAAAAGCLAGGELLLHVCSLVHFLGVKGQAAERAQGGWHLQTRLEALPAEPAGDMGLRASGQHISHTSTQD